MRLQFCLLSAVVLTILNSSSCISAFSLNGGGLQIPSTADAASLSQKAVTKASNNQFMSVSTRRETIKMPSQTPMVPWTVRTLCCIELHRIDVNRRCIAFARTPSIQ